MDSANEAGLLELIGEFRGAKLRDGRLTKRLEMMIRAVAMHPGKSFPDMFDDDAAADGGYRFMDNERVTAEILAAPHARETTARMADVETVLVPHDTSAIMMTGEVMREGLGRIGGTKGFGFYLHASLALDAATLRPLGVPVYSTWARDPDSQKLGAAGAKRTGAETVADPESESRRWLRAVQACAAAAGPDVARRMVHLCDSEADAFWFHREMLAGSHRYVTRLAKDRRIVDEKAPKLIERMTLEPTRTEFDVPIVARKGKQAPRANRRSGERTARTAHLTVTAARVTMRSPTYEKAVRELDVNVVRVTELQPPDGEPPIDWVLYTTEPIDSEADVLRVIRFYRARWLIEELFKALKTGCLLEKRQLESYHALTNALALFIPIAWRMLLLRNVARNAPETPACEVLSPVHIAVINRFAARRLRLSPTSNARDALLAVAGMGGHMGGKEPGWLVLARGMEKLEEYVEVWRAALASAGDVRNP